MSAACTHLCPSCRFDPTPDAVPRLFRRHGVPFGKDVCCLGHAPEAFPFEDEGLASSGSFSKRLSERLFHRHAALQAKVKRADSNAKCIASLRFAGPGFPECRDFATMNTGHAVFAGAPCKVRWPPLGRTVRAVEIKVLLAPGAGLSLPGIIVVPVCDHLSRGAFTRALEEAQPLPEKDRARFRMLALLARLLWKGLALDNPPQNNVLREACNLLNCASGGFTGLVGDAVNCNGQTFHTTDAASRRAIEACGHHRIQHFNPVPFPFAQCLT